MSAKLAFCPGKRALSPYDVSVSCDYYFLADGDFVKYRFCCFFLCLLLLASCGSCSQSAGPAPIADGEDSEESVLAFSEIPLSEGPPEASDSEVAVASPTPSLDGGDTDLTMEEWEESHREAAILETDDITAGAELRGGGRLNVTLPKVRGGGESVGNINAFFEELMAELCSAEFSESPDSVSYSYEQRYLDGEVLSFAVFEDIASGVETGSRTEFYVFRLSDGSRMTLSDFFGENAAGTVKDIVISYIKGHHLEDRVYGGLFEPGADFPLEACVFSPDSQFFTLLFNPGTLGPKEKGPLLVPVEFELLKWRPGATG